MPTLQARDAQAPSDVHAIAETIMQRLERAWNSADGAAFGELFSSDADFVAIRGDLHSGQRAIGEGHQQILDTIYAESTIRYQVVQARELDGGVIVAHVRGTLHAPSGPLAGDHASTITVVLRKRADRYEVAAFHNTLVAD
jgi:uncharacterized protein (TIGR02246 family)